MELPNREPDTTGDESGGINDLSDLIPGSQIGPYVIVARLGRGGMGQVFLGNDPRLQRRVALKCLIPSSSRTEDSQSKILHEARAAAGINHPNVAAVHDVIEQGTRAFIVMEYVEGETLARRLQRGPLLFADIAAIGRQLAAALVAAHASGVIHRDLKPANIQLTADGSIKVLDFGLAKAMTATSATTTGAQPTTHGTQLGTPAYMSPEQRLGHTVDERSDIFSVGIVLFEMETGHRPYIEAGSATRLAGKPISVDGATSRPLRELHEIISKALEINPDRRFQSAAELQSALARLEPVRTGRLKRRLGAGVLAAVLASALAAMMLVQRPAITVVRSENGTGRQTIAVLPLENMTRNPTIADWPALTQALLVGELTGARDLAVMDPLGLNALIEDQVANTSVRTDPRTLDLLRRADVKHVIGGRMMEAGTGYQLLATVIDTADGQSKFSARAEAADEQALPTAAKSLADQILNFLQVTALPLTSPKDLNPWISLRTQKIAAVKAFVEGSQHLYRQEREEGDAYLRRSIDLDPTFIAPKVWLIPSLQRSNRIDEAQAIYQSLKALESTASPFEHAMIGYVGARLRGDRAAQARELDVALGYSPGNNILLLQLASLRFEAGDCTRALEAVRPAVAIQWPFPALYPLFAWCAIETGNMTEAREAVAHARKFHHRNPQEVGLLEALAITVGDADSAAIYGKEFDERAHGAVGGELLAAYDRIGLDCLRAGSFAAAATLFAKAVKADGNNASHHDLLRQAYEKLGDRRADEERRKVDELRAGSNKRRGEGP